MKIEDEVWGQALDIAVMQRCLRFKHEMAVTQAKLIAYEVSKIFSMSGGGESSPDAESPLLHNDPYADASTIIS